MSNGHHHGVNLRSWQVEIRKAQLAELSRRVRGQPETRTRAASPPSFDLRQHAQLTVVPDQGATSRCVAFALAAVAEGRFSYRDRGSLNIPEGQPADVDENAFHQMVNSPTDVGAHFTHAEERGVPLIRPHKLVVTDLDRCRKVPPMKAALVEHGPLFCVIRLYQNFFNYSEGVFTGQGAPANVGHAVCVVGWTGPSDQFPNCWIVRNSMGTTWGKQGGYFLSRFDDKKLRLESAAIFIKRVQ